MARQGGGAGERMFRQLGLCSSYALVRNRDFIKSRGIRLTRLFLGDGLVTAEGDLWLRQRRLMQPASHRERVAAYAETMVALEGR
jgi:cytochrome P450